MREIGRKLFHFAGLLLHPLMLHLGERDYLFWGPVLFAITAFEVLRLRGLVVLPAPLKDLLRPEERRRPTGTFFYLWGVGLTFLIFPLRAALAGLWVLALADGLAGLFGRGPLHHLAFFGVALAVLVGWGLPPGPALLGTTFLLTLIEALPFPDDNLTLPLATAVLLLALGS